MGGRRGGRFGCVLDVPILAVHPPPRGHTQDKHQISLTKARSATAQELARVRGHGMDISTEAPPVGDKQHSVGVKKRQRSWLQLRQEVSVCLTEQCSLMA